MRTLLTVAVAVLSACSPVQAPGSVACPAPLTSCEMRCQVQYYDCAEAGVVVYSCSGVEEACMEACGE